jgi:hypothetical protein
MTDTEIFEMLEKYFSAESLDKIEETRKQLEKEAIQLIKNNKSLPAGIMSAIAHDELFELVDLISIPGNVNTIVVFRSNGKLYGFPFRYDLEEEEMFERVARPMKPVIIVSYDFIDNGWKIHE